MHPLRGGDDTLSDAIVSESCGILCGELICALIRDEIYGVPGELIFVSIHLTF